MIRNPWIGAAVFGGIGFALWASFHLGSMSKPQAVIIPPPPPIDLEARLCDKEVDALLHSQDLVEVTRAGIIVNYIPCAIGRRL